MDRLAMRNNARDTRGQSLVEFALVSLFLIMLLFGVIEMSRLVLVYTTVANAARVGVRYATVHGSDNPISGSTPTVSTVVNGYLSAATVYTANATVKVSYPSTGACTNPGCLVQVSVSYPYNPITSYFPIHVTLASTSQGVIAF